MQQEQDHTTPGDFDRIFFASGTQIFSENENGEFAYVIEEGSVEITVDDKGNKTLLNTLREGDLFGEMALIDSSRRSATATATTDTFVIPINRSKLGKILENADPVLNMVLRIVLKRFRWAMHTVFDKERALVTGEFPASNHSIVFNRTNNQAIQQIRTERELRKALAEEQFVLHYQPILDTASRRIAGYEALLRWNHPERNLLAPASFMDELEEFDLIIPVGYWVLQQACRDLKKLQLIQSEKPENQKPLFMSVNVSSKQIRHFSDTQVVLNVIEESGISASDLKLEFTESMLIDSPDFAAKALTDLQALGVTLALDDFGTGYSSLSYLHSFPLDAIKIDRSFVNRMATNQQSRQIVRAIMGLSKELGLETIAEGIESKESLALLLGMDCNYIQGYLASKPVSLEFAQKQIASNIDLIH